MSLQVSLQILVHFEWLLLASIQRVVCLGKLRVVLQLAEAWVSDHMDVHAGIYLVV